MVGPYKLNSLRVLVAFFFLAVIASAIITFGIPKGRRKWLGANETVVQTQTFQNKVLLICIDAEWDTMTYIHFSVIDRDVELLTRDFGITPCRFRLDNQEDRMELEHLNRIVQPKIQNTTGFLLFDCQRRTHEWYDTVGSNVELRRILKDSKLLKSLARKTNEPTATKTIRTE